MESYQQLSPEEQEDPLSQVGLALSMMEYKALEKAREEEGW